MTEPQESPPFSTALCNIPSTPNVVILQHAACEGPGLIADTLRLKGLGVRVARLDRSEPVPSSTHEMAGLILLGGPMGVHEIHRYPHLREEIGLIGDALADDIPVLGVCLGSQLLASCLGSHVRTAGDMEIGWHPVHLLRGAATDPLWEGSPRTFPAFHWHQDEFDVPRGAVALAASAMTACQAFRFERHAYGVLFHLEASQHQIEAMVRQFGAQLTDAGIDPEPLLNEVPGRAAAAHGIGRRVFARWADLVLASRGCDT